MTVRTLVLISRLDIAWKEWKLRTIISGAMIQMRSVRFHVSGNPISKFNI